MPRGSPMGLGSATRIGAMHGYLMSVDGSVSDATSEAVKEKIASGAYFWLDLIDLDDEGSDLLTNSFHFHPLAVEDAEHFGQRPKVEDYDDFYYLVVAGADGNEGATIEVHCFYSEKFLVTVERGGCSQFDEVRTRASLRRQQGKGSNI